MKITSTSQLENHAVKGLVFAPPGHGKTTLARTLEGKTLIISAESGLLSLAGSAIDVLDITRSDKDEPLKPAERIKRLYEAYEFLARGTDYKNVFIDSLTELSQVVVQALQAEFPDRKDSLVLWGENSKRMRAIIKNFRDLPKYHVIMTALVDIDKDENNKRHTLPDVAGSLKRDLPAFFDEVFYLAVDTEGKRKLITRATDTMPCKDRSSRLEPVEDADLGAVFRKILNKKEIKK